MPCREYSWFPDGKEVPVVVSSGCYNNTTDWEASTTDSYLSGSGGWTSKINVWADVVVGEGLLLDL